MNERLLNVLRILEGEAAARRRTRLGIGSPRPAPSGTEVGVHRIVDVGSNDASSSEPQNEVEEPESAPQPEEEPIRALALYAPEGEALAVTARLVDSSSATLPETLDRRLVLLRDPESPQARSFRLLAHRLRHAGAPKTVIVTSARGAEGKTTCAANLALALAEDAGSRVLLLEANHRTPVHAKLFGVDQPVGLARQLARLETALVPWTTWRVDGGLHLLPAEPGGRDVAPSRGTFRVAVEELGQAFDHLIVDAPSVLESADVMALTDSADAVVLAARAKRTRGRDVEQAIAQLAPATILGVVLLDAKEAARS